MRRRKNAVLRKSVLSLKRANKKRRKRGAIVEVNVISKPGFP